MDTRTQSHDVDAAVVDTTSSSHGMGRSRMPGYVQILLHLGFLAKEAGIRFGEKSLSGGPLGELVQWSDLISSLHLLGHRLIISTETATLIQYARSLCNACIEDC